MSVMSSLEPEDESEGIYSSSKSSTQSKSREISDILAQAENFASTVRHLREPFLLQIQDFPEEIRKKNQHIYINWIATLDSLDDYDTWVDKVRNVLNSRLQDAPGQEGMFQF